jgi:hypothetical protein
LLIAGLAMTAVWCWQLTQHVPDQPPIPYSTFFDKLTQGGVASVTLNGQALQGKFKKPESVAGSRSAITLVAHASPHADPVRRVTIIPRGMALGVTQQTPTEDRHIMTQPELETRLCVMMAGYAAELVVLGEVSTGAENDLKVATQLATNMVSHFGMSKKLGAVYYSHQEEHPFSASASRPRAGPATPRSTPSRAKRVRCWVRRSTRHSASCRPSATRSIAWSVRSWRTRRSRRRRSWRCSARPCPVASSHAGWPRERPMSPASLGCIDARDRGGDARVQPVRGGAAPCQPVVESDAPQR